MRGLFVVIMLGIIALVLYGIFYAVMHRPEKSDRKRVLRQRAELAEDRLDAIEVKADQWSSIDSVLANDVKDIIREYRNKQRELR